MSRGEALCRAHSRTNREREWCSRSFSIEGVAADVPPGVYEVRAAGALGVSNARRFAVGTRAEFNEQEPNDDKAHATPLAFGQVMSGFLAPSDGIR